MSDPSVNSQLGKSGAEGLVTFEPPTIEELAVVFPDFEILEVLGIGGMGAVYKARDRKLDRLVAIKVLPNFSEPDEHRFGDRFEREANLMAQMNHPNIVKLHDSGKTADGLRYIVMEFVDGADLYTAIRTRDVTVEHALSWLPQVCDALSYAHERGLMHRDIKPANLFISHEGTVKLGDFGLAKVGGRSHLTNLTMTNVSMGTPDYAPPEALEDGTEVDHRGDIYSLGVVAYETITGKVPRGAWRAPSQYAKIDPRLDGVIIKAMQPEREDRYQTMAQFSAALKEIRDTPAGSAPAKSNKGKKAKKSPSKGNTRGRKLSTGALVGIILGSIFGLLGLVLLVVAALAPTPPEPKKKTTLSNIRKKVDAASKKTIKEPKRDDPSKRDTRTATPGPKRSTPIEKAPPKETKRPSEPKLPRAEPLRKGWTDALANLNLKTAVVSGKWSQRGPGIDFLGGDKFPTLMVSGAPKDTYEVRFAFERSGDEDVVLLLPVDGKRMLELHYAAFGKFVGLAGVDGTALTGAPNPARKEFKLEKDRRYQSEIRVTRRADEITLEMRLDRSLQIRWKGPIDKIPIRPVWSPRNKNYIHVGCRSKTYIAAVHFQDLPEPTPRPTPESRKAAEQAEAEQKLKELQSEITAKLESPDLNKDIQSLNKSYENMLTRMLPGADAEEAQIELDRFNSGEPMEESDPEGLPASLIHARQVYRETLAKHELARDSIALPFLREQVARFEAIRTEFLNEKKLAASEKVAEAKEAFVSRITKIQAETKATMVKEGLAAFAGPKSALLSEAVTLSAALEKSREEAYLPIADLKSKLITQLERLATGSESAGDTASATAYREQIPILEADEISPVPAEPSELKRLREIYDQQVAPLRENYARKTLPYMQTYQTRLLDIRERMNESNDPAEEVLAKELQRNRTALEAMSKITGQTGALLGSALPSTLFVDKFDGTTLGPDWKGTESLTVSDGAVRATENNSVLSLNKTFRGSLLLEVDLEKEGDAPQSSWDFRMRFTEARGRGSVLFDSGDFDRFWIDPASDENSKGSVPARERNRATVTLAYRRGKMRMSFTNSRRTVETDWVEIPEFEETGIELQLAGGGEDSERIVSEVRVLRYGTAD